MFKPHKDTPEKDLVGTLLMTIGELDKEYNMKDGLFINGVRQKMQQPGCWVASGL